MNKKGFTLIELLAVILILGIIALIAIPTVNNILKESRLGAFEASSRNIIKAAEEKCLTEHMKGNTVGQFIFTSGKVSPALDVKGDLPKSGIINLNENCEATATLSDGDRKYVLTYEGSSVEECTRSSCSFASNLKESDEKYQCFNFDEETGTILKYDGSNPICQGDVYIPAMINDVPVVKINAIAFSNPDIVKCYIGEELTEYPGTYIPKEEDGYCYADRYTNNFSFNTLNMSDAGYLIEVEDGAFYGTGITEIIFNDNLERIGGSTFSRLNTRKIVLPKNLNQLDEWAFDCSNIEELVINNKLKVIEDGTFSGNLLKKINIPEGVEYIKDYAFAWSEGDFKNAVLTLPDSLIGIGEEVFNECNLEIIKFGKNLQYIGMFSFADNYIKTLTIPASVTELGVAAFTNNQLTENPFIYHRNSDGTENKKILNSYAGAEKNVIVPSQVEEIGDYAFLRNKAESITLNDGLKILRMYSLSAKNLTSITIPSTVETIDNVAILVNQYYNPNLTTIINKTGRSFNWPGIISGKLEPQVFETGSIIKHNGEITISK